MIYSRKTKRAVLQIEHLEVRCLLSAPVVDILTAVPPSPLTIGQIVLLTATASDPDTGDFVSKVGFYEDLNSDGKAGDNELLGMDSDGSDGWSCFWDTKLHGAGLVTLLAVAKDTTNAQSSPYSLSLTLNSQPVNHAPTVNAFTADNMTPTVGQMVLLTATASDPDVGDWVGKVGFYEDLNVDGQAGDNEFLGVDSEGSDGWIHSWDTKLYAPGSVTLLVVAKDSSGTMGNPRTLYVNLNNPPTIVSADVTPDPVVKGNALTITGINVNDSDGFIVKAEFYRDANNNGVLDTNTDTLLGSDTNGLDGWTWTGSSDNFDIGTNHYFVRAQDNYDAWSNVVTTTGEVQNFSVIVGLPNSKTVKYVDIDGSEIYVRLNSGTANLCFDGASLTTFTKGSTITVLGNTNLANISLQNTTSKSSLSFNVKGGDGQTTLGGLKGAILGQLKGKHLDITGDIELSGSLGMVLIDDVAEEVNITIGTSSWDKGMTFSVDQIGKDVDIAIGGSIKSFLAIGDIQGNISAEGFIDKIASKTGNITGAIRSGQEIGTVQALSLDEAMISSVNNIKKVTVKGDIIDSWILAGYDIGCDCAFGLQETGGGDVLSSGDVTSVTVKGTFSRSYIVAGTLPDTSLTSYLPNVGQMASTGYIGKVKFGNINYDDADDYFGLFAATEIKPFKIGKSLAVSQGMFVIE